MKILIAGCSGFLGKFITNESVKNGFEIYGIDIIESSNKNIIFEKCDLSNYDKLDEIFKKVKPDYVYNLSALSDIDECIKKPLVCVTSNILGNTNILDLCTKYKVKKFIFASSVYASGNYGGFYASSKKSSEMLIKNYNEFYNLDYVILRYGTLYGVNAPKTNSIKKYITQALKENKVDYTGDGSEVREYIHIEDAARLSIDVLDKKYNNQTISILGNYKIKTKDIFSLINNILDSKIKINFNKKLSKGRSNSHYKISPTSLDREKIYNLTSNINRDLGDAIVEIMKETQNENKKK